MDNKEKPEANGIRCQLRITDCDEICFEEEKSGLEEIGFKFEKMECPPPNYLMISPYDPESYGDDEPSVVINGIQDLIEIQRKARSQLVIDLVGDEPFIEIYNGYRE